MSDEENDLKGFLRHTEMEIDKLHKKIFNTSKKLDEMRNLLSDKEELQAYLMEQIGDDD